MTRNGVGEVVAVVARGTGRAVAVLMSAIVIVSGCRATIPAAPLAEAPPGATFKDDGTYALGGGDELALRVIGDETFTGTYIIQPDGSLKLPLIGAVQAAGRTLEEVKADLEKRLVSYVQRPAVALSVTAPRSYKVYMEGEFARVGVVQLFERNSLLEAVALAGGLTPYASGRLVLVRAGAGGERRRYTVDYAELTRGVGSVDGFRLERGDMLIAE